jgi:hypothetical protein
MKPTAAQELANVVVKKLRWPRLSGYARPMLFSAGALTNVIVLPAKAVADLEKSRLVAGHLIEHQYSDGGPCPRIERAEWS